MRAAGYARQFRELRKGVRVAGMISQTSSDLTIIEPFFQIFLNGNLMICSGRISSDQISPLNEADSISVEIVIIADLFHLLNVPDPVHQSGKMAYGRFSYS